MKTCTVQTQTVDITAYVYADELVWTFELIAIAIAIGFRASVASSIGDAFV